MIKKLIILLGLILPVKAVAMTVEEKQRFLYYFYGAEQLWEDEQYNDAFEVFRYCHAINPKDAVTNRYLGHVYRGCQMTDMALIYYKMAWEESPKECWNEYAVTLYNTGNPQKAIQVLEQTSQLLPEETSLWGRLQEVYIKSELYEKALKVQKKIDAIEGYSAYSAIQKYEIYLRMHHLNKAVGAIEEYLREDPTNLQFMMYRIQLYEAMRKPAKTLIPLYKDLLQLDPFNVLILNNYAYALTSVRNGDLSLAEKMSIKAIQAEPNNPTFLDTYAWILHLTGRSELAKIYIKQAINQLGEQDIPEEIELHYRTINKE